MVAPITRAESFFDLKGIIAAFSLISSLITAYFSFLRGPKLRSHLGEVILIQYNASKKVLIAPELAMFNSGARVAVISKISARLKSAADGREVKLIWNANLVTEHVPWTEQRKFRTHTRFDSFPEIIFVPKSEAVVKRLELVSEHPFDLTEGDYHLYLDIKKEKGASQIITLQRMIRLRRQDENFLMARIPMDQNPSENLRVHFDHSLGAYVSLLPSTAAASSAPTLKQS